MAFYGTYSKWFLDSPDAKDDCVIKESDNFASNQSQTVTTGDSNQVPENLVVS